MTALPLVFQGIAASNRAQQILLLPMISSVLVHSALPHKEFRFLLPLVPLALCYAGKGLDTLRAGTHAAPSSSSPSSS
eukprot:CAMPEP_0179469448 /NCGR_PEP_ID=MMETSP0799-20121207/50135_1 /TAXON_ID=46947 /ORGANISM="Geminigera cryophila, Strain CCMP2564" /LENGTH=77 /DNA_ID=CAMNT_0021275983 /DNA_START=62 /DNA_END=292 /DNA_ORIENTATION=+